MTRKIVSVVMAWTLLMMLWVPGLGVAKADVAIYGTQTPAAFPTVFAPYTYSDGKYIFDPAGEPGVSPIDVDITSGVDNGIGNLPSVYYSSDGDNLFVRLRLKGDPRDRKGGFLSSVWSVQLAANNVHIATVGLDGKSPSEDYVYVANADGTVVHPIYKTTVPGGSTVPGTQVTLAENGQYFLDFQVPISRIAEVADSNFNGSTPIQLFFGTSKAANLSVINKDGMDSGGASIQLQSVPVTVSIDGGSSKEYTSASNVMTGIASLTSGTVSIVIDGNEYTANITSNHTWSFTLPDTISTVNGSYSATATVTSGSGNSASYTQQVLINNASVASSITIDGGAVATTKVANPTITGTAPGNNGSNVRITINGETLDTKPKSNVWSVTTTKALTPGTTYLVTAGNLDSSGKNTLATTTQRLTYISSGTVEPAPTVTIGSITGGALPTIPGTSTNADQVEVQVDGVTKAIVTNNPGAWSVTLERPLSAASHTVKAIATNSSGGRATASTPYTVSTTTITIDNGSPFITGDNQPTIRGSTNAPDNSAVTVAITNNTGTAYNKTYSTTASNGIWKIDVTDVLKDEEYTVNATTINSASATQILTVDTSTSVAITSPKDGSGIAATQRTVSGTADPQATIILSIGSSIAVTTADGDGNWTYTSGEDWPIGSNTISAVATDVLGNSATAQTTFTVLSSDKAITSYSIPGETQAAVIDAVNRSITVTMPSGTDVSSLVASFTLSTGASAKVSTTAQVSGTTANNFGSAVTYTVTAADGSTNDWVITIKLVSKVASVTGNPAAGAVDSGTQVTLSTTTAEATIYYTTNGTDPTTSSTLYTGTITVNADTTIKAIAVKDGMTDSAVSTLAYTITASNHAPAAQNATVTTDEDTAVTITPTATDIDGDTAFTFVKASDPAHGSVTENAGVFTYTPEANYNGTDSFTYTAKDAAGAGSDPATVTITVTAVNDAPMAANATGSTAENKPAVGSLTASDVDGDTAFTFALASNPAHGTVTVATYGGYTYTPEANYNGTDSFTFTATDETGAASAPATVTMTVTAVNAPAAASMTAATVEGTPVTGTLTATDAGGDTAFTFAKASDPTHGSVTVSTYGSFTYTPEANFSGTDSFTFTATDSVGTESAPATVTITISAKPAVASVTSSPSGGAVARGTPVTLASGTDGAAIHYTTDGSTPTTDSPLYTGPITVNGDMTIRAIAVKDGMKDSGVSSFAYTVEQAGVTGILRSVTGGVVSGIPVKVKNANGDYLDTTLTDDSGRYTMSGLPAGEMTVYVENSSRILVSEPVTLIDGNVAERDLTLPDLADITLGADPTTLVGDGHSISLLMATLAYNDGSGPVQGASLRFETTAGTLSADHAATNASGSAQTTLTAPVMDGVVARKETAQIVVRDLERGVFAEKTVTFELEPASIEGVVTIGGVPVAGATVSIEEDLGDPIGIYRATVTTGPDGRYTLVVPRGDHTYHVHITAPVQVDGQTVNVSFEQMATVGALSGKGETIPATRQISGQLFVKGNLQKSLQDLFGNAYPVTGSLYDENGNLLNQQVTVDSDGRYTINQLQPGTYRILLQMTGPNGEKLAGIWVTVTTSLDGEMVIQPSLVDPYGIVQDALTGEPVSGLDVKLYWADTTLNRSKGRVPDELVQLPLLSGFDPSQNLNPQSTTTSGEYAWMVYADADYYIKAEKTGFLPYDSRTERRDVAQKPGEDSYIQDGIIHVGSSIVPYSFSVQTVPPEAPKASVGGTVKSSTGGTVAGLDVKIKNGDGELVATVQTDADGKYTFTGLPAGTYTIYIENSTKVLVSSTVTLTSGTAESLDLTLPGVATLDLTADPAQLVGDGKSTSTLRALVFYTDGKPVLGTKVQFEATAGTLSVGNAATNADGIAESVLTAPSIQGIVPITKDVTVVVRDLEKGIFAEKQLIVTFLPASIEGIVTSGGKPVEGATVQIDEDLGSPFGRYKAEVTTGKDGKYNIVVPKGDHSYKVQISTPVKIGGQTVMVHSEQVSDVGHLSGQGETITANRQISGNLFVMGDSGEGVKQVDEVLKLNETVTGQIFNDQGEPVNKTVEINPDGSYKVDDINPGTYKLLFQITAPDGQKLAGTRTTITVNQQGEIAVDPTLIDPYGIVLDTATNQPISGIDMQLYWADTALNRGKGRTPDTLVPLPVLNGFAPNQNRNPQTTTAAGEYAWMVFADGDYYLKAVKPGYDTYDSRAEGRDVAPQPGEDSWITNGIIHVGQTIEKYDFSMRQTPPAQPVQQTPVPPAPAGGPPAPAPAAPINLTAGQSGDDGAILSWNPSAGAADYEIYQDGKQIAQGVTNVNYTVTGLVPGTEYRFTIKAVNKNGTSAESQILTFKLEATGEHRPYLEGYPDGQFKPERAISRAEVATVLTRILGGEPVEQGESLYTDLPAEHWASGYVAYATRHHLMEGYPDGSFHPEASISRAEMAIVTVRFMNLALGNGSTFADSMDHWFQIWIYTAQQARLVDGFQDGTYRPTSAVSRAEFVTVVNRMLKRGPLEDVANPSWPDVSASYWAYENIEEASRGHAYRKVDGHEKWQKDLQPRTPEKPQPAGPGLP